MSPAAADRPSPSSLTPAEFLVAKRLRELRTQRGYSLRALADRSGLNINTLSLIENGKTSASVSTLQQLARALAVPITAFFEEEPTESAWSLPLPASAPRPNLAARKCRTWVKTWPGMPFSPSWSRSPPAQAAASA